MIRYLIWEARIAVPPGIWLLPILLAVLRLSGVIWPEDKGWLLFLEFVYPILLPLLTFTILEREKNWRTLEVLVAAPRRKAQIFLARLLYVAVPLFCTAVAATTPGKWLLLLAPGVVLGAVALLVGLPTEEEVGLGAALAWWGASFVIAIAQRELLGHPVAGWFFLILLPAPLTPNELLLRKWAQLGAGLALLFVALVVADHKRSWRPR